MPDGRDHGELIHPDGKDTQRDADELLRAFLAEFPNAVVVPEGGKFFIYSGPEVAVDSEVTITTKTSEDGKRKFDVFTSGGKVIGFREFGTSDSVAIARDSAGKQLIYKDVPGITRYQLENGTELRIKDEPVKPTDPNAFANPLDAINSIPAHAREGGISTRGFVTQWNPQKGAWENVTITTPGAITVVDVKGTDNVRVMQDDKVLAFLSKKETDAVLPALSTMEIHDIVGSDFMVVRIGTREFQVPKSQVSETVPDAEIVTFPEAPGYKFIRQPSGQITFLSGPPDSATFKLGSTTPVTDPLTGEPLGTLVQTGDGQFSLIRSSQTTGAGQDTIEFIDGERYIRRGDGTLTSHPVPEPNLPTSMEGLITNAIISGNWEGAVALDNFRNRPSAADALQSALQFAKSPADEATISSLARGEAGLIAQDMQAGREAQAAGEIRRVGPQPDFLLDAFQKFQESLDAPPPTAAQLGITQGIGGLATPSARPTPATGNDISAVVDQLTASGEWTSREINDLINRITGSGQTLSPSNLLNAAAMGKVRSPLQEAQSQLLEKGVTQQEINQVLRNISPALANDPNSIDLIIQGLNSAFPGAITQTGADGGGKATVSPLRNEVEEAQYQLEQRGVPGSDVQAMLDEIELAFQGKPDSERAIIDTLNQRFQFNVDGSISKQVGITADRNPVFSVIVPATTTTAPTTAPTTDQIPYIKTPSPRPKTIPTPRTKTIPTPTTSLGFSSTGIDLDFAKSQFGRRYEEKAEAGEFGEIEKLAEGGIVGHEPVIVGEKGPELLLAPSGSMVFPLDNLSNEEANKKKKQGIPGFQEGGVIDLSNPTDFPLGIKQLLGGGGISAPRRLLPFAGIPTPSASDQSNLLPSELEFLLGLGEQTGIPRLDIERELLSTRPGRGGGRGTFLPDTVRTSF
jgi:hypothetical protein